MDSYPRLETQDTSKISSIVSPLRITPPNFDQFSLYSRRSDDSQNSGFHTMPETESQSTPDSRESPDSLEEFIFDDSHESPESFAKSFLGKAPRTPPSARPPLPQVTPDSFLEASYQGFNPQKEADRVISPDKTPVVFAHPHAQRMSASSISDSSAIFKRASPLKLNLYHVPDFEPPRAPPVDEQTQPHLPIPQLPIEVPPVAGINGAMTRSMNSLRSQMTAVSADGHLNPEREVKKHELSQLRRTGPAIYLNQPILSGIPPNAYLPPAEDYFDDKVAEKYDLWGRQMAPLPIQILVVLAGFLFPLWWVMVGAGFCDATFGVIQRKFKIISLSLALFFLIAATTLVIVFSIVHV